jgi:hypothetical protein
MQAIADIGLVLALFNLGGEIILVFAIVLILLSATSLFLTLECDRYLGSLC